MEVAMAFPVSWKPLVKSNAKAVAIKITRMIISVPMGNILRGDGTFRLINGGPATSVDQGFCGNPSGVHPAFTFGMP
jgi:hypothetical protein